MLLLLAVAAFLAGIAGSFLGIGGGVFLIPFMTLVLQVDIKVAIATSLIGVIATSTGAASVYVRDHLTNLRLGMFLEVATTLGAIAGAFTAVLVSREALYVSFGVVVMFAASRMVRSREASSQGAPPMEPSPFSQRLKLGARYFDAQDRGEHAYEVSRPAAGFGISMAAGGLSGLLGVGGGFIKVPAMNVVMGVPMKPAVATSNFMIGVTAAASAFIYYSEKLVDPSLAAMIVLGVFAGTWVGTKFMVRARAGRIQVAFAILLMALGGFMILRTLIPGVGF